MHRSLQDRNHDDMALTEGSILIHHSVFILEGTTRF